MHSSAHSPQVSKPNNALNQQYQSVRALTEEIVSKLQPEDFVPQPSPDVSPPKWHLAHTTWFFETFILSRFGESYTLFHPQFAFLFNSYYEAAGPRILRTQRGNMSRPTTEEIFAYRRYVDRAISSLLANDPNQELQDLITLGLHHEQQHQELLITDIKYILGHNPLFPAFAKTKLTSLSRVSPQEWVTVEEGIYQIGFEGGGFSFDNELGRHRVFLEPFEIRKQVATNREYLAFIEDGGYSNVEHWLSEGWAFAKTLDQQAPLHWYQNDVGEWLNYTAAGLEPLNLDAPVTHVSYYEADAFARWAGYRLPTEFEWEAAHDQVNWGQVWEWTSSAYAPYPGFKTADGALGEYNGKWMVNQQTLRGASVATSPGHSRATYRNFFHADKRWQFTGIRLCRS
ncbi:MAG: ergothioneine biosynthesis protein EgtB [Saprospiraceae bacterium]